MFCHPVQQKNIKTPQSEEPSLVLSTSQVQTAGSLTLSFVSATCQALFQGLGLAGGNKYKLPAFMEFISKDRQRTKRTMRQKRQA